MYGFPISRKFRCQEKLNKIILRLIETGLFSKHYEDENFLYGLQYDSSGTEESHLKNICFDDLKGIFLMLVSGYVVASTIFVFEAAKNFYFPIINNFLSLKREFLCKKNIYGLSIF